MSAEIALKLELSDDEDDEDEFDEILHRNSSVKSSQVKVKKKGRASVRDRLREWEKRLVIEIIRI